MLIPIASPPQVQAELQKLVIRSRPAIVATKPETIAKARPQEPDFETTVFGETISLTGNRIRVDGAFRLRDPKFTARGLAFDADLDSRTFTAKQVEMRSPGYRFSSQSFFMQGRSGEFEDSSIDVLIGSFPLLRIKADTVSVRELGGAVALGATPTLLGIRLPKIPRLPITIRQQQQSGPDLTADGIATDLGLETLSSRNQRLETGGAIGERDGKISYDLQAAYSLIQPRTPTVAPLEGSVLGENYRASFYSNLRNEHPDTFHLHSRNPYLALTFASNLRRVADFEGDTQLWDRPWSVGVQFGGPIGTMGHRFQIMRESIRGDEEAERTIALGSLDILRQHLQRGIIWDARIDALAQWQSGKRYAWARPMVGATATVSDHWRASVAAYDTTRTGQAPFLMDRVTDGFQVHTKWEYATGETRIGLGLRHAATHNWRTDLEVLVQTPVGALHPWLKWNSQTNRVGVGLAFRTSILRNLFAPRMIEGIQPSED